MPAKLTPRGQTLRWLTKHRGLTEQPPRSNTDQRTDGIRAAQQRLGGWLVGLPWCGVWCANAALEGGVAIAQAWRWASVANIEDDARAHRNGFRGWTRNPASVLRGDLVVLFGRGKHVETVREVHRPRPWRRYWLIDTDGGNTSPGQNGSQSNGGGSFRRRRTMRDVHGFALVKYPST